MDRRTCSTCKCPCTWSKDTGTARIEDYAANSTCTGGTVAISTDNKASGSTAYLDTTEQTETRYFQTTITPDGDVSCAASPAVTEGKVEGESPITVCCTGS
ncbi:MAG: hypothetical protein QM784_37705 [Polyangiaceae bacterium]